jgi:hypothetical protein
MKVTFRSEKILYPIILVALMVPRVHAGSISLESQIKTLVADETAEATVSVVNRGQESAFSLLIRAEWPDIAEESKVEPVLKPTGSSTAHFKTSLKKYIPGSYPLTLRLLYVDGNQYPLSALSVTTFNIGQVLTAEILGVLEPLSLSKSGTLHLRIKATDGRSRRVSVRVVLPVQLTIDPPIQEIDLPAGQEQGLSFHIRNFSALPGSRYPIFAIIEYTEDGRHGTALAPSLVDVVPNSAPQDYMHYALIAFIAILAVFTIYMQIRSMVKK